MRFGAVLLAVAFLAVAASEKARYDNYQVYRVEAKTEEQLKVLHELSEDSTQFPFWKQANKVGDNARILVAPHNRAKFHEVIQEFKLEATLQIKNVQQVFDEEEKQLATRSTKAIDWKNYYRLNEIYGWLDELAASNPNVKRVDVGQTYENRKISALEITFGANLPSVIMEAGIHAREWIGPAATSWIVNEILNSPSDSLLRQFNYLYIPVTNPDGYEYTWDTDRAWRKTRSPHKAGLLTCYGVDPNRNWDFEWMNGGSSDRPCQETYAGPSAASEKETQTLATYLSSVAKAKNYDIYVAFHSFSQLLMYPWGYTGTDTPLEATWKRIGNAAAADLKAVHGTSFEVGSIFDTIYQASGSSIEWYYAKHNSTLTYVFELRDTGEYGFTLPANQIIPSGEELLAAITRFLSEYQKLPPKNFSD